MTEENIWRNVLGIGFRNTVTIKLVTAETRWNSLESDEFPMWVVCFPVSPCVRKETERLRTKNTRSQKRVLFEKGTTKYRPYRWGQTRLVRIWFSSTGVGRLLSSSPTKITWYSTLPRKSEPRSPPSVRPSSLSTVRLLLSPLFSRQHSVRLYYYV